MHTDDHRHLPLSCDNVCNTIPGVSGLPSGQGSKSAPEFRTRSWIPGPKNWYILYSNLWCFRQFNSSSFDDGNSRGVLLDPCLRVSYVIDQIIADIVWGLVPNQPIQLSEIDPNDLLTIPPLNFNQNFRMTPKVQSFLGDFCVALADLKSSKDEPMVSHGWVECIIEPFSEWENSKYGAIMFQMSMFTHSIVLSLPRTCLYPGWSVIPRGKLLMIRIPCLCSSQEDVCPVMMPRRQIASTDLSSRLVSGTFFTLMETPGSHPYHSDLMNPWLCEN